MKLTSQLKGLEQLKTNLGSVIDQATLSEQIHKAADEVIEAAQADLNDGQSPDSQTGELARSLTVVTAADDPDVKIGTGLDYGWHLEFGTLERSPRPWLVPAFETARPSILRAIRDWLAAASKRGRR